MWTCRSPCGPEKDKDTLGPGAGEKGTWTSLSVPLPPPTPPTPEQSGTCHTWAGAGARYTSRFILIALQRDSLF